MVWYDASEHWKDWKDLKVIEVKFKIFAKDAKEAEYLTQYAFDNSFLHEAKQVHFHGQGPPGTMDRIDIETRVMEEV